LTHRLAAIIVTTTIEIFFDIAFSFGLALFLPLIENKHQALSPLIGLLLIRRRAREASRGPRNG
jgi:hypothetical protein